MKPDEGVSSFWTPARARDGARLTHSEGRMMFNVASQTAHGHGVAPSVDVWVFIKQSWVISAIAMPSEMGQVNI